jgi:1-phosphofructokinase family hexose kinase
MILCITLNPCVDRTLFVDKLDLDKIIPGKRSTCIPGGKGNNVARVLKTFGLPVDSFVLLGGHTGCMVEDMIRQQDKITPIVFWTQGPTREVVTVVQEDTHRQVAFKEPGAQVTPSERKALLLMLRLLVKEYEWVVFSGSVPCPALDDIYFELVEAVRGNGGKAVLDSSGAALVQGLRAGPYLLKANLEEAGSVLNQRLSNEAQVWEAASAIQTMKPGPSCNIVALTAGREGAYVVCEGERLRALPRPVQTVNPVGSGDSFLGGMIAGLAGGQSIEASLRQAMAAGAANAAVWDAATFTMSDVEKLLPQTQVQRA